MVIAKLMALLQCRLSLYGGVLRCDREWGERKAFIENIIIEPVKPFLSRLSPAIERISQKSTPEPDDIASLYYILSVIPTSTSTRAGKKDERTLKYMKEGQLRE